MQGTVKLLKCDLYVKAHINIHDTYDRSLWIQVPPKKILYPPHCTLSAFLAATWIHRGCMYIYIWSAPPPRPTNLIYIYICVYIYISMYGRHIHLQLYHTNQPIEGIPYTYHEWILSVYVYIVYSLSNHIISYYLLLAFRRFRLKTFHLPPAWGSS